MTSASGTPQGKLSRPSACRSWLGASGDSFYITSVRFLAQRALEGLARLDEAKKEKEKELKAKKEEVLTSGGSRVGFSAQLSTSFMPLTGTHGYYG